MMTIFKDVILNTHKASKQGVESCSLDHDDQAWHGLNYGNGVDSGRSGPDKVKEYFWIMATGRLKQTISRCLHVLAPFCCPPKRLGW